MGDRTYVTITVRKSDYQRILQKHFNGDEHALEAKFNPSQVEEYEATVELGAEECNYGEWDELQEFLGENKIEYDKRWEAGGEYVGGNAYFRLIKGKLKCVEIYDSENALLKFLEEARKTDPKNLKALIDKKYKDVCPFEITDLNRPLSVDYILELEKETKKGKKK